MVIFCFLHLLVGILLGKAVFSLSFIYALIQSFICYIRMDSWIFYFMDYNLLLLLYIQSLHLLRQLFGIGPLYLGSCVFSTCSPQLVFTFRHQKMFQAHLVFYLLQPSFLLLGNRVQKPRSGTGCAHCCLASLLLGLLNRQSWETYVC